MELKWCQQAHDKVHEVIWDLFKVALLSRLETVETAHLVTGAPVAMWSTAFCRDVFEGGCFEPGTVRPHLSHEPESPDRLGLDA